MDRFQHQAIRNLEKILYRIEEKVDRLMADLSAIQAAVTNETNQDNAIITLLNGIAQELRSSAGDPAAVQALADQINNNASNLAAAVAANQDVAPPAPAPAPEPAPSTEPAPAPADSTPPAS